MALDVDQTVKVMLEEMKPVLGQRWNDIQQFVLGEVKKLAETALKIGAQKLAKTITEQQAAILFDMQKDAVTALIAAVKGIGEESARRALSAGLNAVKADINKELGFVLLQ